MAQPQSSTNGDTALILAAERLFGERGIEAVSLRQINQAAQHRNSSAAHYHFGSKEGLIEAVLMYRLPTLDAQRAAMLASTADIPDIRFYLRCFVAPLVDQLFENMENSYYLRFIQQYEKYRGDYEFVRKITPAGMHIFDAIEQLLAYLPPDVRRFRMGHLIHLVHAVLAHVEHRLTRDHINFEDGQEAVTNLVDMLNGALTAPPSTHMMTRAQTQ